MGPGRGCSVPPHLVHTLRVKSLGPAIRIALAAIFALVAATMSARGAKGPAMSFVYALPAIVLGVGLLARVVEERLGPQMTEALAACALVVPGFNAWYSALLDRVFLVPYLAADRGVLEAIQGAAYVCRCSAPPLFGAAVGLLVLRGSRAMGLGVMILAGAAGARASRFLLEHAAEVLRVGAVGESVRWLLLAEVLAALLVVAPAIVGLLRASHRSVRLAVLLLGVMVAMAGSPPVIQLTRLMPPSDTLADVPVGAPGLTWTLHPLRTDKGDLTKGLRVQGHQYLPKRRWVCHDVEVTRFPRMPRGTVTLAMAPGEPAISIVAMLPTLYQHGIDRIGLVGRSKAVVGILDPWLGWPAAPILLDLPRSGRRVLLKNDRVEPLDPPELGDICLLQLDPDLTVQGLYDQTRALVAPDGLCARGAVLPPPMFQSSDLSEACR